MHKIALIRALVATACALPILAAGCKDEPIPLFDEEGTWVLSLFALEDGDPIGGFGSSLRQDKYMIFYDKDAKIVATAACNDSMGEQGLKTSQCDLPKEQGGYYCRCFNYEFDETAMTWTEFVPKGQPTPPAPSVSNSRAYNCSTCWDSTRIGRPGSSARAATAAFRPSSVNVGGSRTSTTATSGRWLISAGSSAGPLSTEPTTSKSNACSRRVNPSRRRARSSAMTTRTEAPW